MRCWIWTENSFQTEICKRLYLAVAQIFHFDFVLTAAVAADPGFVQVVQLESADKTVHLAKCVLCTGVLCTGVLCTGVLD